jgi:hypothetical protein
MKVVVFVRFSTLQAPNGFLASLWLVHGIDDIIEWKIRGFIMAKFAYVKLPHSHMWMV